MISPSSAATTGTPVHISTTDGSRPASSAVNPMYSDQVISGYSAAYASTGPRPPSPGRSQTSNTSAHTPASSTTISIDGAAKAVTAPTSPATATCVIVAVPGGTRQRRAISR